MSIGGKLKMRRRVFLICGLSLVLVGVFGAGYTVRDLARGITEAPSHWWSTAPWIGIVLGVGLLVLARISHGRTDGLHKGTTSTERRAQEPRHGPG
jgi:uncharacterized membrane protein YhiD involved in acid resistance